MDALPIIVVGLDHHTSPVEVRERLAFGPSQLRDAFDALLCGPGAPLEEAVILSTCNRVEIYGVPGPMVDAPAAIADFLHTFHHLPPASVQTALYTWTGRQAVEHLFSTTCGLNSLIVGENQIQAQVRAAAAAAGGHEALGPVLGGLFRRAVEVGKRARTETGIGRNAASISHAGVELARRLLGGLSGAQVLLVGSGKMSELSAKNLIDNGAQSITVVNRSVEHARMLIDRWAAGTRRSVLPFDALPVALAEADVVLSSTAAPHAVILAEHVRAALAQRPERPLLLIDLAVPRDVDPAVADVPGAHVYDIDDLEDVVSANVQRRREELGAVQAIVDMEVQRFVDWLAARAVVPTLSSLRALADSISRAELDKAMRRLGGLDEREREAVELLATSIVNKLLHQPTIRLKHEAARGNASSYADALRYLFDLDASAHGA